MKVQRAEANNFASYKYLEFEFSKKGLSLISGLTGSGKSTLCDLIPWVLFGKTAKGGAVDEILSWNSNDPTEGHIYIDSDKITKVTRIRGPKSSDLYFETMSASRHRGKDLQDTQRLINDLLGMNYELYLSGAYFHEFSQTAQFFTITAKNRRTICEQLVDLSLPKKLQDKAKDRLKDVFLLIGDHDFNIKVIEANLKTLLRAQDDELNKEKNWDTNQELRIKHTYDRVLKFEENRVFRIEQVIKKASEKAKSKICSECGAVKTAAAHKHDDSNLEIVRIENEENPYALQYQDLVNEKNPHKSGIKDFSDEIEASKTKLAYHQGNTLVLNQEYTDLSILKDSAQEFRGLLIKNTILDIEEQTNLLLSNHFDAEIKIELAVEDADKLEVSILKDGNSCSYTQLSKGQRQLLKLCFGVSVMRCVSNHHGIDFSQLFFDEATDGMDEVNKIKAVKMLETLALNKAVYIVEHSSEVKAMVDNKYQVELVNGSSVIHAETQ